MDRRSRSAAADHARGRPGETIEYTRTVFVPSYPYNGRGHGRRSACIRRRTSARVTLAAKDRGLKAYDVAGFELVPQAENIFLIFKDGLASGRGRPRERRRRVAVEPEGGDDRVPQPEARRHVLPAARRPARPAAGQAADGDGPHRRAGARPVRRWPTRRPVLRKVAIPAAQFGTADMVELRARRRTQTFVPAHDARGGAAAIRASWASGCSTPSSSRNRESMTAVSAARARRRRSACRPGWPLAAPRPAPTSWCCRPAGSCRRPACALTDDTATHPPARRRRSDLRSHRSSSASTPTRRRGSSRAGAAAAAGPATPDTGDRALAPVRAVDDAAGRIARIITALADAHGVDARLVHAVIAVESAYQPRARSRKGARGLMQLMPATARQYGVRNAYRPAANLDAGVRHLKTLLDRFDVRMAARRLQRRRGRGPALRRRAAVPRDARLRRARPVARRPRSIAQTSARPTALAPDGRPRRRSPVIPRAAVPRPSAVRRPHARTSVYSRPCGRVVIS